MIQVSPPIETKSPPIENGAVQGLSDIWGLKAQKKNKPGIFAKMLEGLYTKVNSSGNNNLNALRPGNTELHTGKNSLKALLGKKATGTEFFDENDALKGFFNQDLTAEMSSPKTGMSRSAWKEHRASLNPRDQFRSFDNLQKTTALNEELKLHNTRHKEKEDSVFSVNANRSWKGAGNLSGDRAKSAGSGNEKANVLSFSFRQMEAEFQNSLLRSGLIRAENTEKENSRLSEFRGKKGRANVEVRDLRTGELKNTGNIEIPKGEMLSFTKPIITEFELPVDLGPSSGKGQGGLAVNSEKTASSAMNFEDMLAQELRGNLSTDIVQSATVIVRNGGEGTIRLALHPASLGDVKIRLEMTENKITGHIIVQSSEALRAFERELPVLEKAFRDSGFSETNLEMSLAQDGNYGEQGQEGDFQAFTPVQAASLYEAEKDLSEVSYDSLTMAKDGLILPDGSQTAHRVQVNLLV